MITEVEIVDHFCKGTYKKRTLKQTILSDTLFAVTIQKVQKRDTEKLVDILQWQPIKTNLLKSNPKI